MNLSRNVGTGVAVAVLAGTDAAATVVRLGIAKAEVEEVRGGARPQEVRCRRRRGEPVHDGPGLGGSVLGDLVDRRYNR